MPVSNTNINNTLTTTTTGRILYGVDADSAGA